MHNLKSTSPATAWKEYEKFIFRVTALFVLQICIPLNGRFYTNLFNIQWSELTWQQISGIASGLGAPDYIDIAQEDIWGFFSYINLFVAFAIAVIFAIVWSLLDRKRKEYNTFYYWIRVIARYRLAFGIIAWGYKKFIPIQMELPTLTFLETPYADFSEQKLYWQGVGITQNYEIFLGFAEVLCGLLLMFRKTTALGAAITAVLLININIANHAYEGMVHVPSFTYALLGTILLWYHWPAIWQLVVKEQDAAVKTNYPSFGFVWQKFLRKGLKVFGWGTFVYFLLYLHWIDDLGYRFPHNSPGLKNAEGVYGITEFRINNKTVPYSPLDTVRWQDAVFEKWSTLTFKVNRLQQMDLDNTGREGKESINKRFEFRGIGGGRHYFDYKADTVRKILYLTNKNKAHRDQKQVLHYEQPSSSRMILSGVNEFQDSIYVVLDKKEKEYPLYLGRRSPVSMIP